MIGLSIQVQQLGGFMVMQYHAEENATTTEPEKEEVKEIVALLQEKVAKQGGRGKFVENHAGDGN